MILLGISGKKGTGKDLLASILAKKYGFINLPFAGALKEQVRKDFGFTTEHTDGSLKENETGFLKVVSPSYMGGDNYYWTPREIMIAYGQFFRQFDKNWWVKRVFDKIHEVKLFHRYGEDARITISDVRFINEADYIKANGGIVIRLNRPQELNIYPIPSTDISETELDTYEKFDLELPAEHNRTPEELEAFADTIMKFVEVQSVGNCK